MADPFEVRMRFTSQLQHLNASVTSSQKAAHYALKYRDMDEDLHSCILEQLEKVYMRQKSYGKLQTYVGLELNEQSGKHHVLYRTLMRYGATRKSLELCQNDTEGYIQRGGCCGSKRRIWSSKCEGREEGE